MSDKQKNIFTAGGIICAVVLVIALIFTVIHTGGTSRFNSEDAKKFKQEYEVLNGNVS